MVAVWLNFPPFVYRSVCTLIYVQRAHMPAVSQTPGMFSSALVYADRLYASRIYTHSLFPVLRQTRVTRQTYDGKWNSGEADVHIQQTLHMGAAFRQNKKKKREKLRGF